MTSTLARRALLGLAFLLGACGGSARVVVRDARGGLLDLEGDPSEARRDALRQILAHCGPEHAIVFEGEVRVPRGDGAGGGQSATEVASRMTLASDLPGALENSGSAPSPGPSLDESGTLRLPSPDDGARTGNTGTEVRRRLEYECDAADPAEAADPPVDASP